MGTCYTVKNEKTLIFNKKASNSLYYSIYSQLFNYIPRYRFEKIIKNPMEPDIATLQKFQNQIRKIVGKSAVTGEVF